MGTAAPQTTATASASAGPSTENVAAVADTVTALMRTFMKARTQMLAAAEHDVEWSAQVVLKCLSNEGPLRSSAVADLVNSDPSTVSRQIAALVRDGLVERRADPVDGRASLLVLTPKAADVLHEHDQVRNSHFAQMLAGWSDRDMQRFVTLLRRFHDDFTTAKSDSFPERVEARPVPAEGKN